MFAQGFTSLPVAPAPVAREGKCAALHAMWIKASAEAGVALIARKDAVAMGENAGFNPATARTQFQVLFRRIQANVVPAAPAADPVETPSDETPAAETPELEAAPVLTRAQKRALAKAAKESADAQ